MNRLDYENAVSQLEDRIRWMEKKFEADLKGLAVENDYLRQEFIMTQGELAQARGVVKEIEEENLKLHQAFDNAIRDKVGRHKYRERNPGLWEKD